MNNTTHTQNKSQHENPATQDRKQNPENMDKIDYLQNNLIQAFIQKAMDGYTRVTNDEMQETLLAIADTKNGLPHSDIQILFDKNRGGFRYTKPFRESEPPILVPKQINGDTHWDLNTDFFQDIIEKRQRIEQLHNEVFR
jgi:hypothetical protein